MVRNFLISNTVEVIFSLFHPWHEYPKVRSQLSLYPWLYDIKFVIITLILQHNEGTSEQI